MRFWIVLFVLFSVPNQAWADACLERFKTLLEGNSPDTPVKIHITQEVSGAPATKNWFYGDGQGNWMTEMIEPETMQWTLFRSDSMYSSTDKGSTWSFVREMNSDGSKKAAEEMLEKHRASATNTICGSEEVDGTTYETVSGEYTSAALQGAAVEQKYWVEPATDWIARSYTNSRTSAFEMKVTQVLEVQSSVDLPNPE